ncbi:MAG: Sensor histidine kinase TmoS, partial [Bacteroidota bacterium]
MLFVSLLSFSQKYSTKLYDESFGCFQKNISEILRDKDGFLWLGTESGLVRYDGSNFNEFFPKENKFKNLGFRKIKKFNDAIYLNYEKNGVLVFDLKKYQYKKVFNEPVIEVQPLSENSFIVLTESGYLEKISNGKMVQQSKITPIHGSLMALFKGVLYVSLPQIGIITVDTAHFKIFKNNIRIIPDGYRESFDAGDKNLAFVSKSEVKIVAGDLIDYANIKNALIGANPNDNISYYKYIAPQSQFFIIQNKYICNVTPSGIGKLYFKNIVNCELLCLFSIDSNNFFVGSGQGLIEVRNVGFQNRVLDDNISLWGNALRVRRSILEKKDGSLILMGYPRNIKLENNHFTNLSEKISSSNQAILLDDYIYACYDEIGFNKINTNTGKSEILAYNVDKKSYFGIYHDTINHFIIAGGNGFLAIHNLQKQTTKVLSIFKERIGIRAIIYDPVSDNYWLGTANGLYVCDRNFKITKHFSTKQNNANGDFYSALLMPKGSKEIWAAHNEGVSIFDTQTQKLINNLPSNLFLKRKTVSLIEDNAHRIWMGTYQGIIGFDPKTRRYIRLTTKNNLINSEFNYASATKLANGNLIFGGLNAYDIINPTNFKFDTTSIKPIVSG